MNRAQLTHLGNRMVVVGVAIQGTLVVGAVVYVGICSMINRRQHRKEGV